MKPAAHSIFHGLRTLSRLTALKKFILLTAIILLVGAAIVPTVTLHAGGTIPPQINKNFVGVKSGTNVINPGEIAHLTITLFNSNTFDLTNATFTDNLVSVQPGMFVATPPNASSTCIGAVITAAANATSVGVTGATIPLSNGVTAGSCTVTVDVSSTTQGNLINTIAAGALTAVDNANATVSNTSPASATLAVNTIASLTAAKQVIGPSGSTFYTGNTATFQIRITNNDNTIALTNVGFDDDFVNITGTINNPNAAVYSTPGASTTNCGNGAIFAPAAGDRILHLSGATIAPRTTCTVQVTVTQTDIGVFNNNILQNNITDDQGVSNSSGPVTAVYSVQANVLNIGKTFGSAQIDPGVDTPMTITLKNPNPSTAATGVTLNDTLPAGLIVDTGVAPTITNCGGAVTTNYASGTNPFTISNATVAANNATTCTVIVQIKATVSNISPTNNIFTTDVNGNPGFGGADIGGGIAATASITINGLDLTKTYGGASNTTIFSSGATNRTTPLKIVFTNPLNAAITKATLTDTIGPNVIVANPPNAGSTTCTGAGFTFAPVAGDKVINPQNIDLPANGSCFIQVDVTSNVVNTNGYVNNLPQNQFLTINGSLGYHPPTSATLVVVPVGVGGGGGGLSAPFVGKNFSNGTPAVGQTLTLTVTIQAPEAAPTGNLTNVTLNDPLPAGMVIANTPNATKSGQCGPGNLSGDTAGATTLSMTGGAITGGQTCTVKVDVFVTSGGTFTNTINNSGLGGGSYVSATNPTDGGVFNANAVSISLNASANFQIGKSFSVPTINANGTGATLDISITAPANLNLNNVAFTDPIDARLIPQTPTTTAGCGGTAPTLVGNTLTWAGGIVFAGQTCDIKVVVTAKDQSGIVTNALAAGSVTGTFGNTGTTGGNANSVSVNLGITGVAIAKSFQPATIGVGGVTTMVISFTNYANVDLTGLAFSDDLVIMGNHVVIASPNQILSTCGGPGTVTAVPATTQVTVANGTVPHALNGVPGTCQISIDVTTNPGHVPTVPGTDTNTIKANTVTTTQGIVPIKDATAVLKYAPLKLVVTKAFNPGSVTAGTTSNLSIVLQNNQGTDLQGVSLLDDLPQVAPGQGMFVAASGASYSAGCTGTPTSTGLTLNSISFTISGVTVAANTTCTITVVVSQNVATTLTNTIFGKDVKSKTGIQQPQDTQASLVYTAFLGVNKAFSSPTALSDQPVTLTIQFVNAYPNPLTMQSFTDDLAAAGGLKVAPTPNVINPCGLTINAAAGASAISVTGGTLPANSACIISVDVTGNALKTYINTIPPQTVTTKNPGGSTIQNASGSKPAQVIVSGYSIGNRVWLDDGAAGTGTNNDGIINGNEKTQGIGGVSVSLLSSTNAVISTITTDVNGYYRFDNLTAGTYSVRIDGSNWTSGATPLRGLVSSTGDFNALQNTTTTLDNHDMGVDATNFTVNGIKSGPINLGYTTVPLGESDLGGVGDSGIPDNQANLTVDFALTKGYNIGNRVWLDNGAGAGGVLNDGIINGSENAQGIDGVTVTLLDSTGTTPIADAYGFSQVTTSGGGYYRFDGLPAGSYKVRVDAGNFAAGKPLFNYVSSKGDFNAIQNNAGGVNTLDNHDMGIDSPTYLTTGILSNVINLSSTAPTKIPAGETDTGGTRNGFADSALPDTQTNLTVDFAVVPDFSIGNRVWRDDGGGTPGNLNNGVLDAGESGISGVSVSLLDSTNAVIGTVTTDANGYYRFDGLLAGTYTVRLDAANWTAGAKPLANLISSTGNANALQNNAGGVNTLDNHDMGIDNATYSLYTTTGITSGPITLSDTNPTIPLAETDLGGTQNGVADNQLLDARSNLTVDFGLIPTFSVGNRVWKDDGGGLAANVAQYDNGKLDASESGLGGVTVYLYPSDVNGVPTGAALQTVKTDAAGYYRFDELTPSTPTTPVYYVVAVDTDTTVASPILTGLAPSDVNFNNLTTDNENKGVKALTIGAVNRAIVSPAFSFAANAITTETDVPGGLNSATPQGHGQNGDAYDNLAVDFSFIPTYSLGNRLWYDNNNNGKLDLGESPVAGAQVDLLDSTGAPVKDTAGNPMQATTDANGYYRFDGLNAGDYYVLVDNSNWKTGPLVGYASSTNNITQTGASTPDSFDNGVDSITPATNGIKSTKITLGLMNQPSGEDKAGPTGNGLPAVDSTNNVTGDAGDVYDNLTADFGFYRLSVGDTVWNDNGMGAGGTADNGKQDGTEPGLSGVTVQLFKAGVLVAQTQTNGSGNYLFDQQTDNTGKATGNPLVVGKDYTIVIPKGQGVLSTYSSSADVGSTFSPTTNGVDKDDNGKNTNPAATSDTTTDTFTLDVFGALDTAGAVLNANASTYNPTLDFGFYTTSTTAFSIGNRVWFDNGAGGGTANNGVQEAGEPGIDGVRVLLYKSDAGGNPTTFVQTQDTSLGGYYRFDNVMPGTYVVIVDRNNSPALSGLIVSNNTYTDYTKDQQNKGAQTPLALGSPVPNGVPSGLITVPVVPPVLNEPDVDSSKPPASHATGVNGDAQDLLTVDFSFYQPASTGYSIGNRVWLDNGTGGALNTANDGIQNGNEPGIANVTVNLYNANAAGVPTGPILKTQVTDGSGYYRFDNVGTGSYVVVVDTTSPALNGLLPSTPVFTDYTSTSSAQTGDKQNKGTAITVPVAGVASAKIVIPPAAPAVNEPDVTTTGQGAHSSAGDANDILTVDFGFNADKTKAFSIGNRVWLDDGTGAGTANDGVQSGGETGLALVSVKLFAADASGTPQGVALQTVSTDANGYYRFDGVTPGNYVAVLDLPSFNASSATKYQVTGVSFTALDAPSDKQNKGKQTLLDAGTPLPGGIVSPLITVPAASPWVTGETDVPGVDSTTPEGHGPNGDTMDNLTADFGLKAIPKGTFSIGNRVFLDNGGGTPGNANNGKQDAGEPGIPNVTVFLYTTDAGGKPIALVPGGTTMTDNSGYYRFDGVAGAVAGVGGKYVVVVDTTSPALTNLLPSTPVFTDYTTPGDQQNKGKPVTAPPVTGVASGIIDTTGAIPTNEPDVVSGGAGDHGPLGDATDILTADFAFHADQTKAYSIGNRVWFDNGVGAGGIANDGIQNGTEPGIPNVKLDLFYADASGAPQGNTPIATTTTSAPNAAIPGDTGGYYRFDSVTAGNYVVVVDKAGSSALNGFTPSAVASGDYGATGEQHNKGHLPPLTQSTQVSGGIASGLITVPTTGTWITGETDVPSGLDSTVPSGHGPNNDVLDNLVVDFGFAQAPATYSIGNRVWNDLNADGIQQSNEPGISGVKLLLYKSDTNGTPTTLIGNVVTDAQGFYRFDGLVPGDYVVILDQAGSPLGGWTPTKSLVTTPNTNATDALNNGTPTTYLAGAITSGKISLGARPSEPLGELVPASDNPGSVYTVGAAPQSSDDHGNLTIDFGFIAPPQQNPNTSVFDPAIVKLVDPALALPGEVVTYTITVNNRGNTDAVNAVVTDPVSNRLTITGANTPQGTYTISGNTVTFSLGTIKGGQVITMIITARIRPDVVPPVDFDNIATAVLNGKTLSSTVTLHVTRGNLPNTGEHSDGPTPSSTSPIIWAIAWGGCVAVFGGIVFLKRRRTA